jgi:hypothetical protein
MHTHTHTHTLCFTEYGTITQVFSSELQNLNGQPNVWGLYAFLEDYEILKVERIQNLELWFDMYISVCMHSAHLYMYVLLQLIVSLTTGAATTRTNYSNPSKARIPTRYGCEHTCLKPRVKNPLAFSAFSCLLSAI